MGRDVDGLYTFVGRSDDMFVCGGKNIYPGEVERLSSSTQTSTRLSSCHCRTTNVARSQWHSSFRSTTPTQMQAA